MAEKKDNPIEVMLVDDNVNYCIELAGQARLSRILIKYYNNLQSAMEELRTNKKFKFVILDGKCFIKEENTSGEPDLDFVNEAMMSIRDIESETSRAIPYCINTGFLEDVRKIQKRATVFNKGNEEELLKFIWAEFKKSAEGEVKFNYPDIYEFAKSYFSEDNFENLMHLLHDDTFLKKDTPSLESNLTKLRKLNEHLMDIFAEQYFMKKPMEIADNGGRRTVQIADYIMANDSIPRHLSDMVKSIYYTCSSHGSHNPSGDKKEDWKPGANAVASMTYGLLEIIAWMNTKIS